MPGYDATEVSEAFTASALKGEMDGEIDHFSTVQSDTQTALEVGGGEPSAARGGQGGAKEGFSKVLLSDRPCR